MLAALDYAHNCTYIDIDGMLGKGIIHGDIKPHNIFLDRVTYKVKLSDFMISGCASLPRQKRASHFRF